MTPSPSPSPRHSCVRPQALALQRTKAAAVIPGAPNQNPNTLHPLGTFSLFSLLFYFHFSNWKRKQQSKFL